jgi:hypothetical protein
MSPEIHSIFMRNTRAKQAGEISEAQFNFVLKTLGEEWDVSLDNEPLTVQDILNANAK